MPKDGCFCLRKRLQIVLAVWFDSILVRSGTNEYDITLIELESNETGNNDLGWRGSVALSLAACAPKADKPADKPAGRERRSRPPWLHL